MEVCIEQIAVWIGTFNCYTPGARIKAVQPQKRLPVETGRLFDDKFNACVDHAVWCMRCRECLHRVEKRLC